MASPFNITLMSNVSANATSNAFAVGSGRWQFSVSGNLGGGSVTLEILGPDGSTYFSAGNSAVLSSNSSVIVEMGPGTVRTNFTGATSPNTVHSSLTRVGD